MSTDYHMIEGTGSTIDDAERAVNRNKDSLVAKIGKAKVSKRVAVAKVKYIGNYELNKGTGSNPTFSVESNDGWKDVNERAAKRAVENYTSKFTVQKYINLTKEQKAALEPKSTPACFLETGSSLDSYFKRL